MYQGKRRFDREQLVFVVESIMLAAFDTIASALPPTVPMTDYLERKHDIGEYIQGITNTVGLALPILFAQLNDEGMGQQDFHGWQEFEKTVVDFIERQTTGHEDPWPSFHAIAELFVDKSFVEYLVENRC